MAPLQGALLFRADPGAARKALAPDYLILRPRRWLKCRTLFRACGAGSLINQEIGDQSSTHCHAGADEH